MEIDEEVEERDTTLDIPEAPVTRSKASGGDTGDAELDALLADLG
jgi:hypothetical protein